MMSKPSTTYLAVGCFWDSPIACSSVAAINWLSSASVFFAGEAVGEAAGELKALGGTIGDVL